MLTTQQKLGLGSCLACVGGLSVLLMLLLDPNLGRPWSFLVGFAIGLLSALGAGLALVGLAERRNTSHR